MESDEQPLFDIFKQERPLTFKILYEQLAKEDELLLKDAVWHLSKPDAA